LTVILRNEFASSKVMSEISREKPILDPFFMMSEDLDSTVELSEKTKLLSSFLILWS
jgi:hypothetical protein